MSRFNPHSGGTYEDTYSGWLEMFREVAESEIPVTVSGIPLCWLPLMSYLGANVQSTTVHFPCDQLLQSVIPIFEKAKRLGLVREFVESFCTFRPELVDAMWKSDMEWNTQQRWHVMKGHFVVTNNGSFHRPEVLQFMASMEGVQLAPKAGIVLVPCAADKPYPAPLHKAVRAAIPAEFRIAVVTGVLGVVPEEFWHDMPQYDSGIPNRWRAMKRVEDFFRKHDYPRIVVYSDFYSEAIRRGLDRVPRFLDALYPLEESGDWTSGSIGYLNLLDTKLLGLLARACE